MKWSLGSAYPPNNKTVTADELSDRPLIAKISQYTDNSYIGIAGLKGGFGDIAASLDTLTQNTVRTGDDIQVCSTRPRAPSRATSTSTPSSERQPATQSHA